MKSRKFIHQLATGISGSMIPMTLLSFKPQTFANTEAKKLNFGIVTDVHKDLMPDADDRLEKFINEANNRKVDFIIQMGDFCMAEPKNKEFLDRWESFRGDKYHVLGNHDMDKNSKKEMLDFWGMPKTHYSYDFNGFHFIILDANFLYEDGKFIDYEQANFYVDDQLRTFIDREQIEWFKADLAKTTLPTIVFSHQSLWHYQWGVKNRLDLQKILEEHKHKVICCLNGHNHIDYHHHQNGIDYIDINSMSYQWMPDKFRSNERFSKELYDQYKLLPHIASYKDPLFAFASIDPKGVFSLEGVQSEWTYPSPYDLGMPKGFEGQVSSAELSNRLINFKKLTN